MINLLIVDDHQLFLSGLKILLESNPEFKIVDMANNGAKVIRLLKNVEIDVILLDINMPILNGYEVTFSVKKSNPKIKILALSMLGQPSSILKMLEAGADGFVFKNVNEDELTKAIHTVVDGDYYVSEENQHILKQFLKDRKKSDLGKVKGNPLSGREIEILKLIIDGLTNNEVGQKLFISPRTVDTHRKNILAKLEIKNTATLVKFAMANAPFLGLDI